MSYPKSLENLIRELEKFPGVGRKSAERIAFFILNSSANEAGVLSKAILSAKENIKFCRECNSLSEKDICGLCSDSTRSDSTLCIVEQPKDVMVVERAGAFKGRYYVLLGNISPLDGRGPEDLKIKRLLKRLKERPPSEVIIATNSDTEGEATAIYLTDVIKPLGIKVSRIGVGIPMGSNLEYFDPATLSRALEGRREV